MASTVAVQNVQSGAPSRKALRVTLWAVQILLAAGFGMAGFMKSTLPFAELSANIPWASDVPAWLVRFIGVAEFLGGAGLILPAVTRIRPNLTALAGAGLLLVMVLAAAFHVVRGEFGALPTNLALGGLAAFVAWGRYKGAPIAPRS